MTTEYHDDWANYAKDITKQESLEAEVKKNQDSQQAFLEATKPRNQGYEFRGGHKTKFPEIEVLEGEDDELAAFRVASERRQAGVEHFTLGTIWGAQAAVDDWGQGILALERLKNLRKYKPLRNVSLEATDGDGGDNAEPAEPNPSETEIATLSLILRLNMAQALLKLKQHEACVAHCEKALELDPTNLKALWRKAQAVWGIRNPGMAREALERLLELDEGNPAAVAMMHEIETEEQRKRIKRTGVKGSAADRAPIPEARRPTRGEGGAEPKSADDQAEEEDDDDDEGDDGDDEEDIGFWEGFFAWLGKIFCRKRQKFE